MQVPHSGISQFGYFKYINIKSFANTLSMHSSIPSPIPSPFPTTLQFRESDF